MYIQIAGEAAYAPTDDDFDEAACAEWIQGKQSMWRDYGFGPWAFIVDGEFAGWGGLQPEHGDADLGLVLHPDYWGKGKIIYAEGIPQVVPPLAHLLRCS